MHNEIMSLIKRKDICVLATVSKDRPHCSLMAYVTDEDCRAIYLVTHRTTKKYNNLLQNPFVSLLIDNRDEFPEAAAPGSQALTIFGLFQKMDNQGEIDEIRLQFIRKHPRLNPFIDHPDAEIVCIKVQSLQLLDGLTDSFFEEAY